LTTPINLTDLFLGITRLGAEWVLWLLLGLSVISLAIMLERAVYFLRRRVNIDQLLATLTAQLRAGDMVAAFNTVADSQAIECQVARAGISEAHRGAVAALEAMHSARLRERLRMESYLSILGTLGNNAPFVGLLGTVLGIIKASQDLAAAQAAKEAGADAVMGGVFEALVATAVGLFVAIPAVVGFNYFMRRVRTRTAQADVLAHLLISLLQNRVTTSDIAAEFGATPVTPSVTTPTGREPRATLAAELPEPSLMSALPPPSSAQTVRVAKGKARHGRK
jgi:biopolymer transport protein ExbB